MRPQQLRRFTTNLVSKSRDQLAIWTEFNQLALKYNAINLNHGTPGLMPPDFLLQNMQQTLKDHANNQYTMFTGHPLLREAVSEYFSPLLKNGNRGRDLDPNTQV